MDPRNNMQRYLTWTFILILVLILSGLAFGEANAKTWYDNYIHNKKAHACVDCDLNKTVFEYTENVVATKVVANTEFNSEVANIDKVETILEKIEKIETDKGVYYDKITTIQPKKVDGQYCFIKVIIKQTENTIIKEEILECADGRKKFDGPSYWELFAQFYYRDIFTPEYCRMYSRNKHLFKTPGKVCLMKDGEWEVR
jgi:hypothetical protein